MIKLYIFPAAFGLRNVSPFCLKVEMALKYLDSDCIIFEQSDSRKSPKGKLPFIVDGNETIADSELIFDYLNKKSREKLYGSLPKADIGKGFAWVRLAEDRLYWLMVASRWLDDEWWPQVKNGLFDDMPSFRLISGLENTVPIVARRKVRQSYLLHGLGKQSLEEQKQFAQKDLSSLNNVLAKSPYLLGEELTVFDFSVASLLAGIIDNKPATWLTLMSQDYPQLRKYTERVQQEVGVWGRHI